MEQSLFTSEAAKNLGVGVSTLRKYAALLEAKGYEFERGQHNNGRIFKGEDLEILSSMLKKMEEGLSVEAAAESMVGQGRKAIPSSSQSNDLQEFIAQIKELEVQQASLTEMNRHLVKQVEILTEKIEEREREQQLFRLIEESRKKKKRKGIAFLGPLNPLVGKR
ncbi:hypothetical protein [Lederbergia galactosidilytica]|uniref:helix-turn-helix domain-containing protein n=1 Tax=Lederbergia galactosidilytica TaxID=217031 RepID=UPI0007DB634A|nr:hypothetical protein [Lederbergia galactosidilytica]MBP1914074.1 DNA-binding transcriptional MerR regulator [Lederbergia galactosidilytica]